MPAVFAAFVGQFGEEHASVQQELVDGEVDECDGLADGGDCFHVLIVA